MGTIPFQNGLTTMSHINDCPQPSL
uniref:Uncharacterized protein n=1 Tax=Anguilla anguilla TaxID=7936 RepID=A0A0E9TFF7_ANGAN